MLIRQGEATAARRQVTFTLRDGAFPVTGVTLTSSVKVRKAGAAAANAGGTLTEHGHGWYTYQFTAGECDTIGELALLLPWDEAYQPTHIVAQIVGYDPADIGGAVWGTVIAGMGVGAGAELHRCKAALCNAQEARRDEASTIIYDDDGVTPLVTLEISTTEHGVVSTPA